MDISGCLRDEEAAGSGCPDHVTRSRFGVVCWNLRQKILDSLSKIPLLVGLQQLMTRVTS
jgi:hypothetical protein